jgi:hypothetical protein
MEAATAVGSAVVAVEATNWAAQAGITTAQPL